MFKIFKKFAFVALMALFHVYESWGVGYSAPKLLCCSSNSSGCGWGGTIYAPSLCSSWCKENGYNYYKYVSFYNCNGTGCACYNTSAGNYSSLTYKQCSRPSCPGETGRYWGYPGEWSGTTKSSNGAYSAFTCRGAYSSACDQTNTWTSYTIGMQRQVAKVCGGNVSVGSGTGSVLECLDSDSLYNYRCDKGYYGLPRTFAASAPTCTHCPSTYMAPMASPVYGTTAAPGAASYVTQCYQPANVTGISDSTGSWTWTQNCFSCGADQPTCTSSTVSTACWASGFTSCTSQGCCMSSCSTYVCDPTASLTATYGVQSACYAHGYTLCVNNCCANYCSTTMCTDGTTTACHNAGYNNQATCTNKCCSGTKCNALFGASVNTAGRCTSDSDCRADTSDYDYSCDKTTGCCTRASVTCRTVTCNNNAQCIAAGYETCNTTTRCCNLVAPVLCESAGKTCSSNTQCLSTEVGDCDCTCDVPSGSTTGMCVCTRG